MSQPTIDYGEYLESKKIRVEKAGFEINIEDINPALFPFQKALVKWAIRRGRGAVFADTGLGKTAIMLEWARHIIEKTSGKVLILAPLCVSHQTVREGVKFDIPCKHSRYQNKEESGIVITNYEMMDNFNFAEYSGIVLDESSIIKHESSKTRAKIIELGKQVPYRLSCSATPAPNDYMELGSQSEFLGVMDASEMLAMFFIHDGGDTSKWRLKGHGKQAFWDWLSTWAMVVKLPSDIGYDNTNYNLPALLMHEEIVESPTPEGELFPLVAGRLLDRNKARRESISKRVERCAEIVNSNSTEQFVVWCHLNKESEQLHRAIPGSVEVRGSNSIREKEIAINGFTNGEIRVLITKPSIAGFGMNWQHVHNMCFVGLSDSWEQFYQAIRREWRFGQKEAVNVYVISAQAEGAVLQNIKRKESQAKKMSEEMVKFMHDKMNQELEVATENVTEYKTDMDSGENWTLYLGDCVETVTGFEPDSIDYTIFSPPFASLYSYSNDHRDMGNCKDNDDFARHFSYLIPELFRVTKPGRIVSAHCMNIPSTKVRDGVIGLIDFRGELIRLFVANGFIFHSEVTIWKDPVTQMQRTKSIGLLHRQLKKDSAMSRMALPDYVVSFRKPGENKSPIGHTPEEYPVSLWQNIAEPIWTITDTKMDSELFDKWLELAYQKWMDIDQSNTLNRCGARESDDEKHICPLQIDVIDRCLHLWSNPNDLVLSPFAGIGSEGYQSIKRGRRFVGCELKKSYWESAVKNLQSAKVKQLSLSFDE
jgi:DNA modification methylase